MKGLKSFDFFQKIAVDNVTQPTAIGSLLSLSAISICVFLLLREVWDFLTPSITKESIIYQDRDQASQIKVNMNIVFPKMPCYILSVDQQDQVGHHRLDISDTLKKSTKTGAALPKIGERPIVDREVLIKAIDDGESCTISGFVPISKAAGNIHISHHNYADSFEFLMYSKVDHFNKISLEHNINTLTFGDIQETKEAVLHFGYNYESFNPKIPMMQANEKTNYDYFIKLIPYLFVDTINGQTTTAYQFSVNYKTRPWDAHGRDMPGVFLQYDFSPITMKLTLKSKSFMHSVTHICGIVGGVYVLFSILNRILLTFCDFSASDTKRGVSVYSS